MNIYQNIYSIRTSILHRESNEPFSLSVENRTQKEANTEIVDIDELPVPATAQWEGPPGPAVSSQPPPAGRAAVRRCGGGGRAEESPPAVLAMVWLWVILGRRLGGLLAGVCGGRNLNILVLLSPLISLSFFLSV